MAPIYSDQQLKAIAENRFADTHIQTEKFGHQPLVPSSGFQDIWGVDANYTFQTVARTLTVQSSGNDNGAASTGAKTIIIEGLDANWNEISEEIATNAAVDPTTTNSFLRVNIIYVGDVGTLGTNEGIISVTSTTDLNILAQIGADKGQSEQCIGSIPAGRRAEFEDIVVACGKGEDFEVELQTCEFGKGWRVRQRLFVYQGTVSEHVNIKLGEKGDFRARAKSITNINKPISVSVDYIQVPV